MYRIRQIASKEIAYLVTDGCGKYSHGKTLQEAKADLVFKISNRDKTHYNSLCLDSELTFEESIECYRIITGACSFGTKDFVFKRLKNKKDKYSISEIIALTRGEFGHESFKNFFKTK